MTEKDDQQQVKAEPSEANGPNNHQEHNTGRGGRGGYRGGRGGGRPSRFHGPPGGGRTNNQDRGDGVQDGAEAQGGYRGRGDGGDGSRGGYRGRGGREDGGDGSRGGYRGRGRGGGYRGEDRGPRSMDDRLNEKLMSISGPTIDLPPSVNVEKKFGGRARLYIGNVTNDISDEELNALFSAYGETHELFVNREKNFAFIRMDYRSNAEKAKRELDGSMQNGHVLKVRYAPIGASIKVKNLTPWVSNELLELSFSIFGEVERAIVIVDERGNSKREGIVEFARKNSALAALRKCAEGCYFLTSSLRPVVLEPYEPADDTDGYQEKNLPKKSSDYFKAREVGPRLAAPGTFEYEYGTRWKQLYELYKQKEEALLREMKLDEEKLDAQMEYARYEQETEILREQLRQRELDRERQKREWELKERQAEEQRRADEEMMRRQQEEMSMRMLRQEEELRRRQQENSLFMAGERGGATATGYETAVAAAEEYEAAIASGAVPAVMVK